MNKKQVLFALMIVAALPRCDCGDNNGKPDAPKPPIDAQPSVPVLGPQIDRLGRPAINTALNHAFDPNAATKGAAKDAYNQDGATGTWITTYSPEFAANLALVDAVDYGLDCTGATCVGNAAAGGCGNQAFYNGVLGGGGTASATSYAALAAVTADDQLYVDTTIGVCGLYLGVELGSPVGIGTGSLTCGGRAPSYDVMRNTYGAVSVGLAAFDAANNFAPKTGFPPTVTPHADTSDTAFPFLGAPH